MTVSNWFEVLDALEDPVELWDTFKRDTLEAARGCVGGRPRSRGGLGWLGAVQGSVMYGGGGEGCTHKVHGWDKLMLPVGSYLVREGSCMETCTG